MEKLVDAAFVDLTADREIARIPSIIKSVLHIQKGDWIVRVFDNSRNLIYTNINPDDDDFLDPILKTEDIWRIQSIKGLGREYVVAHRRYKLLSGEPRIVQVAVPLLGWKEAIAKAFSRYLIFLGVLMLLSLFFAKFLTTRLIAPVKCIAQHLSLYKHLDLKQWSPIPQAGDSQFLEEIVSSTNNLVAHLQKSYLASHHMARYIAHEIRTPLTMMLGEIETSFSSIGSNEEIKTLLQRFARDIIQLDVIVKTILELAHRDKMDSAYNPRLVNLTELVEKTVQQFQRVFETPVEVKFAREQSFQTMIDPDLFAILLDNLLRNSAKHGGRSVVITIERELLKDSPLRIVLEDRGPGLPPEVLKAANSQDSLDDLGIGLSLCREVCNTSGWEMKFLNRALGGIRVELHIHDCLPAGWEKIFLAPMRDLSEISRRLN